MSDRIQLLDKKVDELLSYNSAQKREENRQLRHRRIILAIVYITIIVDSLTGHLSEANELRQLLMMLLLVELSKV